MCAMSYFDIGIEPRAVQQGAADALQQQQAQSLAVTPAVSLRGGLEQAQRRRQAQQQLALRDRRLALGGQRLALTQDAAEYAEGQAPWEIGLGALGGATRLYGGYRALEDQKKSADVYQQMLAGQRRQGQLDTERTTAQVGLWDTMQQLLKRQGYFQDYSAAELG